MYVSHINQRRTMSTYTNLPIARRLLLANTAISNALADPEMIGLLTPYTYDETKLQEGLSLYQEVEALHHSTFTERGEKLGATSDLHDRWSESRGLLRDKIARARIALRGNTGAIRILKLDQPRAQRQADWIIQARQFYTAALDNQDILDALDTMNISEQGPQGPVSPICQKLALVPIRMILWSGKPANFFHRSKAWSSSE